jgi:hypothetical protein
MGKLKAICTALTIFILSPANAAWSGKYLLLYLMTTNPNLPANVIVLGTFDNLDDCKDAASAPKPAIVGPTSNPGPAIAGLLYCLPIN